MEKASAAPRLDNPLRITDQVWPVDTLPVVSIHCMAYNHEPFIREAIEGILMQETTFPVEILIHDDASEDRTAEIIRDYAMRHPQLFKPVFQTENQYSRGNKPGSANMARGTGEFLAWCEGDDCWIDPRKLEKQVRLMEENPDVPLTFHNAWVKHADSRKDYFINHGLDKEEFDFADLVPRGWFIATASMMCRRKREIFPKMFAFTVGGDLIVHLNAALQGRLRYLNFVGSIYRIHEKGASYNFRGRGDFFYQRVLPDRIWVYWIFLKVLAQGRGESELRRYIRSMAKLWFEPMVEIGSASALPDNQTLQTELVEVLRKNEPPCAPEGSLGDSSELQALILDGATDALATGSSLWVRSNAKAGRLLPSMSVVWTGWKRRIFPAREALELLAKACLWSIASVVRPVTSAAIPAGRDGAKSDS